MKNEYLGKVVSFKIKGWKEIITGSLINFNDDWILIKPYYDYTADGLMFINNIKINKFRRDEFEIFAENVISLKNVENYENIALFSCNINAVLSELTEKYGVIGIKTKSEEKIWIGKYIKIKGKKIFIKLIGTRAIWTDVMKFNLSSIKSIDFNTDYNNALYNYNSFIEENPIEKD